MCTSSDNNDDWYYDNYISRGLCGTGPVNQQDFTIQDAVNIGLRPKHKSKGHCWICPLGCLYVSFSHPYLKRIQENLLSFANKGTHPIYTKLLVFELSPMKIHAIKSLHTSGFGDITEIVEEIIDILETLSMNHLPLEVKMFVKNCDIMAHQYNQHTLIGASDSMQGFHGATFSNILDFLINFHSCPDLEFWRARQQKIEPEPTATTYTSLDGEEDGYDDNCIYSALQRWVESRLQKELLKPVKDYKNHNDYNPFDTSERQ